MRVELAIPQVLAVRDALGPDVDDERLLAGMIEGETEAYAIAARLVDAIEREEGDQLALKAQVETREARKKRSVDRQERLRAALAALVQATGLPKMALPEATISIRGGKPKLTIVAEDAVPDQFQVVKRSPDKQAINAAYADADELPNWLSREAAQPILNVRRK